MKARRIVQVSAFYPPHLGGQEYVVHDLAQQLGNAGHHVQVLTSAAGSNIAGAKVEDGVLVKRMRGPVLGHAPIMPAFPVELFRTATPDTVVHLHIGQAFTPEIVWLASRLRHFKYVAELHIDFEPSGPLGVMLPLYKRMILKRVLQSAESVITLNERTLQAVREHYGYTGPAQVMHNGIDEEYYTLNRPPMKPEPPKPLRLLFVGRLSKQKNLPALLRALTLTQREVRLDVLGDGEELGVVRKAIDTYKLTNVTMHGRKERGEILEFYKTNDVLVMPSLYEAQPLVLLEAMAAGIPIIGTNVIGVADHIREAGIVVEPTAEGLAEGIERYYAQYSTLETMINWGRMLADAFRWRNVLKDYERLYEAVLEV